MPTHEAVVRGASDCHNEVVRVTSDGQISREFSIIL